MKKTIPEKTVNEIASSLTAYYPIFRKFVEFGVSYFDDSIDTAAVVFDKDAKLVELIINEDFFTKLNSRQKCFVICHEVLHVLFEHANRFGTDGKWSHKANIATDIVINELLVESMGFSRSEIDPDNLYVWLDKYLPEEQTGNSAEFYYSKLPDCLPDSKILGSHCGCSNTDLQVILDSVAFNSDEAKFVESVIGMPSGTLHGVESTLTKEEKKNSILLAIKKIVNQEFKKKEKELPTWARRPRRAYGIAGAILPSDLEYEGLVKDNEHKLIIYIDLSLSCQEYHEKFISMANFMRRKVEVQLYGFTTKVFPIINNIAAINGGTSFRVISDHFNTIPAHNCNVVVLTDGYGDKASYKSPERWNWFITPNGNSYLIDKKCNIFDLEKYK